MEKLMTKRIVIKHPEDWTDQMIHDHYSELRIEDDLGSCDEIEEAMDLDVSDMNQRAEFVHAKITNVDLNHDSIAIDYDVEWSAHYGCSDFNSSGIDSRSISGSRKGNTFTFDVYDSLPDRTTLDEF
jgi:hypothetical protein